MTYEEREKLRNFRLTLLEESRKRRLDGHAIPMILFCPACGIQHIDAPDPAAGWMNPPHKSHLCADCGHIWRPSNWPTMGVAEIESRGKADHKAIRERTHLAMWWEEGSYRER